jgi:bifunctional non-homologous end joining protein LigD
MARGKPSCYAFDLIELDGHDMRARPWDQRRNALAQLLDRSGRGIRLSEHLEGTEGAAVFRHACAMGLEGIVAKRRNRPYRSDRCADWVKVRNPEAPAATRIMEWE